MKAALEESFDSSLEREGSVLEDSRAENLDSKILTLSESVPYLNSRRSSISCRTDSMAAGRESKRRVDSDEEKGEDCSQSLSVSQLDAVSEGRHA